MSIQTLVVITIGSLIATIIHEAFGVGSATVYFFIGAATLTVACKLDELTR